MGLVALLSRVAGHLDRVALGVTTGPGRCPANLWRAFGTDLPCQLDPGHRGAWHRRWSSPIAAQWREDPDGTCHIQYAHGVTEPSSLYPAPDDPDTEGPQ